MNTSALYEAVHWTARILGSALFLLFVVFAVGEGPPPLVPQTWALLAVMAGILLAWWREALGGALVLLGALAFYLLELVQSAGVPGGWYMLIAIALGLILAWWNRALGAIVVLAAGLVWVVLEYVQSGSLPGGWVFPLLWVVGALFVMSALLKRGYRPEPRKVHVGPRSPMV